MSAVRIFAKHRNDSEPKWVFADWSFCVEYARGEYTFIPDRANVLPSENFEDVVAFTSEIDRLRKPARGIMTWELREELTEADQQIWDDSAIIFMANHNQELYQNDLVKKLVENFRERYANMSLENLPRRFREIRAMGWFAQTQKASYYLHDAAYADLLKKERLMA